MNTEENLFPVEAIVLSNEALTIKLRIEYSFKHNVIFCRLHYRSIHDTYYVKTDKADYFFKVYRFAFRTKEEIQEEIDCLLHLKECGINTTEPIEKNDGSYIMDFNSFQGARYGVLYSSVGIKSYDEVNETEAVIKKIGVYISSMHNAWDKFNKCSCRWQLDSKSFIDVSMKHIKEFSKFYSIDLDFLEQVAGKTKLKINTLDKQKPEYGICHGDFYSGNWRYDINDNPIMFDFDFCGYGWRAYDISMYSCPFSMGCDSPGIEKRERRKEAFLEGYNSIRVLSMSEINSIYFFIPFRRIFNIGSLYIFMANVWGDQAAIRSANEDIILLKKWIDCNPVL